MTPTTGEQEVRYRLQASKHSQLRQSGSCWLGQSGWLTYVHKKGILLAAYIWNRSRHLPIVWSSLHTLSRSTVQLDRQTDRQLVHQTERHSCNCVCEKGGEVSILLLPSST